VRLAGKATRRGWSANTRRSPISSQLRFATPAGKIASQSQLKLVLTREGIGYGGVDITSDVEKALNITEKATPTPGFKPVLGTLKRASRSRAGRVVGDGSVPIARIASVEEARRGRLDVCNE